MLRMLTDFDKRQQAIEILVTQFRHLTDQGKSDSDAISHLSLYYGVPRDQAKSLIDEYIRSYPIA